ncbi:hypothetical protein GCM10009733_089270 [Nonomuraea maheshkhaliensis]|uniref:Secreted protein n=1 Tax=Nonomuraea maheshkhaliensis TaxID=419590 RepID=A0ABN2GXS3_9ACTN
MVVVAVVAAAVAVVAWAATGVRARDAATASAVAILADMVLLAVQKCHEVLRKSVTLVNGAAMPPGPVPEKPCVIDLSLVSLFSCA